MPLPDRCPTGRYPSLSYRRVRGMLSAWLSSRRQTLPPLAGQLFRAAEGQPPCSGKVWVCGQVMQVKCGSGGKACPPLVLFQQDHAPGPALRRGDAVHTGAPPRHDRQSRPGHRSADTPVRSSRAAPSDPSRRCALRSERIRRPPPPEQRGKRRPAPAWHP